jgi:prepilin-type N-terminal cleavage/methylation domain-containing protein
MSAKRSGFTLIEVLIVVVIMAVLAATIIPQFSTSTQDAQDSQIAFNMHTLRSQIELYKVQHNGTYPPITNNLQVLTVKTNADGTTTGTPTIGPYLIEIPMNGSTGLATVAASTTGTATGASGWLYDATTGKLWADAPVVPDTP